MLGVGYQTFVTLAPGRLVSSDRCSGDRPDEGDRGCSGRGKAGGEACASWPTITSRVL